MSPYHLRQLSSSTRISSIAVLSWIAVSIWVNLLDVSSTQAQEYGLRGEYFTNGFNGEADDCSAPGPIEDFIRIDPTLDFNWGDGAPTPDFCYGSFRVRWTAWLTVPETGDYLFSLHANDSADLYVDGRLSILSRNIWGAEILSLTAGERVPLRVDFAEGAAYANINLLWVPPWESPMPNIGWVFGQDIQAMFGEQFVSRGHRLGLLVPTEMFTPREPEVEGVPRIQLLASDSVISEGRSLRYAGNPRLDGANFYVYSDIVLSEDINIQLQIDGDAEVGVDYNDGTQVIQGLSGPQLFYRAEGIRMKAHHSLSKLSFSQVDNFLTQGTREIEVTLLPGQGYEVGEDQHLVIRIFDDETPIGVPGIALGGVVRGLGSEEWAVIWVQRAGGAPLAMDFIFEDDVFILDDLPEDDLELHGVVDLNLNGAPDPGEPRLAHSGIPFTLPPTNLDIELDFARDIEFEEEEPPVEEEEPPVEEEDPPVEEEDPPVEEEEPPVEEEEPPVEEEEPPVEEEEPPVEEEEPPVEEEEPPVEEESPVEEEESPAEEEETASNKSDLQMYKDRSNRGRRERSFARKRSRSKKWFQTQGNDGEWVTRLRPQRPKLGSEILSDEVGVEQNQETPAHTTFEGRASNAQRGLSKDEEGPSIQADLETQPKSEQGAGCVTMNALRPPLWIVLLFLWGTLRRRP